MRYIASDGDKATETSWTTPTDAGAGTTHTVTGLTNGQSYEFEVRAVNGEVPGGWSGEATATPRTVPGAPTDLQATPANGEVVLSWTAPTETGGSAITGYEVRYIETGEDKGTVPTWTTPSDAGTGASHTVTGLTNGDEYEFEVRAVNAAGGGDWSMSATATPRTVPDAPTGLQAAPANGQAALSWTAPANTGGSSITGYEVRYIASGGDKGSVTSWTTPSSAGVGTTHAVTGLTNGGSYEFQVRAVNAAGAGGWSNTATATPNVPPGVPTSLGATPGNGQVSLTWTAPATGTVAGYQVRYIASDGDKAMEDSWTTPIVTGSTGASHTVTGLTNGEEYEFQVRAVNGEVPGGWSGSTTTTPRTTPDAPTGLQATPANGEVGLTWTAPAQTGGSAITGYEVRYILSSATDRSDGQWSDASHTGIGTTYTVTGLTNGESYDFQVKALTEAGGGSWSATATATPRTVPNAPTGLAPVPDDGQVSLMWTAPTQTGGSDITGYQVRYILSSATDRSDGQWSDASHTGVGTAHTVTGLTNGEEYEFEVRAENAAGEGGWSDSATATPNVPPGVPTSLGATPGNLQVALSWTAPATGTVTGYQVRYIAADGDKATETSWTTPADIGASTSRTVVGLTNGDEYEFQVRAVNGDVPGGWSGVATATPRTVPDAPTGLGAVPADGKVALSWTAPANTGGSVITGYQVRYIAVGGNKGTVATWTTPTDVGVVIAHTVVGLTNGEEYEFEVRGLNAAGGGAWSDTATATPRTTSDAPTGLQATPADGKVALTWTAPAETGGSVITGYDVRYILSSATDKSDGQWSDALHTGTTATHTVSGLTNGEEYEFQVRAVSAAGGGAWSDTATATPNTPPGVPTSLGAVPGSEQVVLSWTAPTAGTVTGYQVRYILASAADRADGNWSDSPHTGTGATHTVTGLTNGEEYEFEVRAVNGEVPGGWSDEVSATPRTTPNAPTGLQAAPANGQVTLSWTAPANAGGSAITGYEVRYIASGGDKGSVTTWTTPSSAGVGTTYTVSGLTNGQSYEFETRAVNVAGGGDWSASATATPRTTPDAPTGLQVTPAGGQVALAWTAPTEDGGSAIAGYDVRYIVSNGDKSADANWTVSSSTGTGTTHTVASLTNGQSYDFQVRAKNTRVRAVGQTRPLRRRTCLRECRLAWGLLPVTSKSLSLGRPPPRGRSLGTRFATSLPMGTRVRQPAGLRPAMRAPALLIR